MGRRNRVIKSQYIVEARRLDQEWRTAIYARLSYENNGREDESSLINQVTYVKEYINGEPNLHLVDEYIDNGKTGTNFERPQFLRLMEDIKSGKINCVVVKDLSRFGRNYLETGYYLEKIFPFLNIRFIAINDHYDSMDESTRDSLIVPIKNLVNEMYSRDISRKITATMRMKEKKGEIWYGSAAYGYYKDPKQPFRLLVDEVTAPFVRMIFQWTLSNISYGEIVFRLNRMKAITPRKRRVQLGILSEKDCHADAGWTTSSVKKILHNPIYMGDAFYNRSRVSIIEGINIPKQERNKWCVVPNTHEALVSKDDFEKIACILDERTDRQNKKQDDAAYLREAFPNVLQGYFYCSDCGRNMYYYRDIRKGSVNFCDYYCSGYRYGRTKGKCERHAISDRLVRTIVMDQIRMQIDAACELKALLSTVTASNDIGKRAALMQELYTLKQDLTVLTTKRQRLYEDYVDGLVDAEEYRQIKENYNNDMKRVTAAVSENERLLQVIAGKYSDAELTEMLNKVTEHNRLTRELVEEMIGRVEYGSDGIIRVEFRHKDWIQELNAMKEELI